MSAVKDQEHAEAYRAAARAIEQRGLRDFLDFLCGGADLPPDVSLCTMDGHGFWQPVDADQLGAPKGEQILAAYYDIDLDAVERHRVRLLEELDSTR